MDYKQPDRRVVRCWTMYTLVLAPIPLTVSILLFRLPSAAWLLHSFTIAWVATLTLLLTIYYPLRYRRMRYALDNHAVVAVRGVIFVSRQQVSLSAVRHITTICGPIERFSGIRTLFIRATGGQLLLEGIPADEADKLMQALL